MVRKTKGADWHDRPGFLVGICTEGRFGSLPAATAPPRTAKALEASGPRCGHCIPDGPASNVSFTRDRLGYLRSESLHRHRTNSSARLPALLSVSVAERTDEAKTSAESKVACTIATKAAGALGVLPPIPRDTRMVFIAAPIRF